MLTTEQSAWLKWVLARLRERSTWAGLLSLIAGVTGYTFNATPDEIAAFVGAAIALVFTVAPDKVPGAGEPSRDPWDEAVRADRERPPTE